MNGKEAGVTTSIQSRRLAEWLKWTAELSEQVFSITLCLASETIPVQYTSTTMQGKVFFYKNLSQEFSV